MRLFDALGRALLDAGSMTWQITWSLILGFTLSAVVQAVVRRESIARHLGSGTPRTLALATGLAAASSSCSYAAVALARALVRRGASFTAAMAFEIASTNLVIELGIILALLIFWQFTAAEFVGGPIMIVLMAGGGRRGQGGRTAGGQPALWRLRGRAAGHHPVLAAPRGRALARAGDQALQRGPARSSLGHRGGGGQMRIREEPSWRRLLGWALIHAAARFAPGTSPAGNSAAGS
jgi:Predicted permease